MDSEISARLAAEQHYSDDPKFSDQRTRPKDLTYHQLYLNSDFGSSQSDIIQLSGAVRLAITAGIVAIIAAGLRLADAAMLTIPSYVSWRQSASVALLEAAQLVGITGLDTQAILGWAEVVLAALSFIGVLLGGTVASFALVLQFRRLAQKWKRPSPFWPISPGCKGVYVSVGESGIALTSETSTIKLPWTGKIDYNIMINNDVFNSGLREAYSAPDDLVRIGTQSDWAAARAALGEHVDAIKTWARSADCLRIPLYGYGVAHVGTGPKAQKSHFYATAAFPRVLFHQGFSFEDFVILCAYHAARSGNVNSAI
jgi:hypothetical protein